MENKCSSYTHSSKCKKSPSCYWNFKEKQCSLKNKPEYKNLEYKYDLSDKISEHLIKYFNKLKKKHNLLNENINIIKISIFLHGYKIINTKKYDYKYAKKRSDQLFNNINNNKLSILILNSIAGSEYKLRSPLNQVFYSEKKSILDTINNIVNIHKNKSIYKNFYGRQLYFKKEDIGDIMYLNSALINKNIKDKNTISNMFNYDIILWTGKKEKKDSFITINIILDNKSYNIRCDLPSNLYDTEFYSTQLIYKFINELNKNNYDNKVEFIFANCIGGYYNTKNMNINNSSINLYQPARQNLKNIIIKFNSAYKTKRIKSNYNKFPADRLFIYRSYNTDPKAENFNRIRANKEAKSLNIHKKTNINYNVKNSISIEDLHNLNINKNITLHYLDKPNNIIKKIKLNSSINLSNNIIYTLIKRFNYNKYNIKKYNYIIFKIERHPNSFIILPILYNEKYNTLWEEKIVNNKISNNDIKNIIYKDIKNGLNTKKLFKFIINDIKYNINITNIERLIKVLMKYGSSNIDLLKIGLKLKKYYLANLALDYITLKKDTTAMRMFIKNLKKNNKYKNIDSQEIIYNYLYKNNILNFNKEKNIETKRLQNKKLKTKRSKTRKLKTILSKTRKFFGINEKTSFLEEI